jgi:hypothetical protein
MPSFLARLLFGAPKSNQATPARPAQARPGPTMKSAARLADEQNILNTRRAILANLARIEQNPSAKQKVLGLIDQDTDRASQVVRNILLGQERK